MAPTPTTPDTPDLTVRQVVTTVTVEAQAPSNNNNSSSGSSGMNGGEIAGIVIGVIVGLLLIWWIVRSLSGKTDNKTVVVPPGPDRNRQGWYDDMEPVPRRHSRRESSGRHHHHHRSSSRSGAVIIEDKYAPRRPSATYVAYPDDMRRSRSTGRSRSRSATYYAS